MDSVCDLFTVNKQQAGAKKIVTESTDDLFRKLKFFDRFMTGLIFNFSEKFVSHLERFPF